jgi:hypothetical protein
MAFHVEMRRSFSRAWAFNLDEERLHRSVAEPWQRGKAVELGDREWDPKASTLKILEGPELTSSDLSLGRGWHNAERSAQDVTARVLESVAWATVAVAVLAENPSAQQLVTGLLGQLGIRSLDWARIRPLLGVANGASGSDPASLESVLALLVVDKGMPSGSWLFEAGLALGALGGRAIVAQIGDAPPPPELRDLDVILLSPGQPASLDALAGRLRAAGRPERSS